jgi:hypothetical protein
MPDRDINATRKRFVWCWHRRSLSTPEVAAPPPIILDKGNLTYLKKIDGSQHPGSISLNYFAQRPFARYSANVCLYLARLLSLGWPYPLLGLPHRVRARARGHGGECKSKDPSYRPRWGLVRTYTARALGSGGLEALTLSPALF